MIKYLFENSWRDLHTSSNSTQLISSNHYQHNFFRISSTVTTIFGRPVITFHHLRGILKRTSEIVSCWAEHRQHWRKTYKISKHWNLHFMKFNRSGVEDGQMISVNPSIFRASGMPSPTQRRQRTRPCLPSPRRLREPGGWRPSCEAGYHSFLLWHKERCRWRKIDQELSSSKICVRQFDKDRS